VKRWLNLSVAATGWVLLLFLLEEDKEKEAKGAGFHEFPRNAPPKSIRRTIHPEVELSLSLNIDV
jgi:hypothetical protein